MPLVPGSVLAFKLPNGMFGSCRVLRGPRAEELPARAGRWLVCATPCIAARPEDVASSKDTKKALRTSAGPTLAWMEAKPPKDFVVVATLPVSDADAVKSSPTQAPWAMFQNVVFNHFRSETNPAALARDRAEAHRAASAALAKDTRALAAKERIDLDGLVPLPIPKADRTPEQVLRGFIAAMCQWEKESARIDAKNPGHLASRLNVDTQQAIFNEFCTAKERKNGRRGSYQTPPEYDPKRERIKRVVKQDARRADLETERRGPLVSRIHYVLLKTRDGWLIDSRRIDGRATSL